jgi:hypothetical protein
MFLKKLNRRARSNGMTPESALSDMLERRKVPCGQVARDLRTTQREVFFWADAFDLDVEDVRPKIIEASREKGVSLRAYFLKNVMNGVGWMAEDLGVAFTTVEEYYAVFTDGEKWRMNSDGRSRRGKRKGKGKR